MNGKVIPFLALLVSVAMFFAYVNPTWTGEITETKAAIAADDRALEAAAAFAARQKELISARDAIDPENLARLTKLLPDSVNNVGLILDLNALAAKSGLVVSSIDLANPAAAGATGGEGDGIGYVNPVQKVDFSLAAVGTYAALKTFLTSIEKSGRLLDVQDLSLQGSETGVYTYRMMLRIYWLR